MHLWLLGERIGWTPAPAMIEAVVEHLGLPVSYEIRDVPSRLLPAVLTEVRAGAVAGCHITAPYKRPMALACDELSGDAEILGTVNTIAVEGRRLVGDNTEPLALELGLSVNWMWPRAGSSVVILGAGEFAAAAALALSRVPCREIVVSARRLEQSEDLAMRLVGSGPIRPVPWDRSELGRDLAHADLVLQCTPSSLADLPLGLHDLGSRCTVADVRLLPRPVDIVVAAQESGRRACDGVEVFLYQQMLALQRWTGVEPAWDVGRAALVAALDAHEAAR